MFEFPWVKARKRRAAEQAAAELAAKLQREEKERRAAQILSDQILRSQMAVKRYYGLPEQRPERATLTPIRTSAYGLTAQRAAAEDRQRREERLRTQHDDYQRASDDTFGRIQSQMALDQALRHDSSAATWDTAGSGCDSASPSDSSSSNSNSSSTDSSCSGGSD